MSVATFDFTNLIIKAQDFVTMDAEADIYSEWKRLMSDEVATALRMGAPPAFEVSVGGNPIGGGQSISPYFFVRNDCSFLSFENHSSFLAIKQRICYEKVGSLICRLQR